MGVPIRKLTGYQREIDAIKSNYRPLLLSLSLTGIKRGGGNLMMDRLRSPVRTLGVTAVLICVLSLAGLGMSHARPSNPSQSVHRHGLPCNAVCKAYMAWSHRVTTMFRPTRPLEKAAARHRRPPHMMAHRAPKTRMVQHAPRMRQRSLNSFAQLPAPRDATREAADTPQAKETPQAAATPRAADTAPAAGTAQSAATPQAEVAPSRPVDQIADRFPTVAEFLTARRVEADGATDDAPDSTGIAGAGTTPATEGTSTIDDAAADGPDLQLVASLLLMLGSLPTFVFWWWFRARRDAARKRERLLTFDRAVAGARRKLMPIDVATELGSGA